MRPAIGVDVGGTSIKAGRLDDRRRGPTLRVPTPGDPSETVAAVVRLVGELSAAGGPEASIGVAVPGVVDEAAGVVRFAANLGWRELPLRALLAEALGDRVRLGHDVRAGGLAEHRLGAARGFASSVCLPLGTGIAAALILDGRPYSAGGWAGEVGHVDVGPIGNPDESVVCACGLTGCLEAYASASAIARRYETRTGRAARAEEVLALAAGDPDAAAVTEGATAALGRALAMLTGILAPEAIVLAGGLSLAGEPWRRAVEDDLHSRLSFHRAPSVRLAALGAEAGWVGAALLGAEA